MKKYKFSVIVPIYNVEKYLEETILSVVNQSIGFEENVELILVNDGSLDNSEAICLKYKEMYPNNVIYVKQKNGGVSLARNNGLSYASGEIINFLDSDDLWQKKAFKSVYNFFLKHDIDVVACMIEHFEAKNDLRHPLNNKFLKGDRIIDINDNPELIQLSAATAFIRKEAIGELKFDSTLKHAEDSLFINQIILKKQKYGVLKSVHYMYRKRNDMSSALNISKFKKYYYNDTIKYFSFALLNISKNLFNEVIPYIQHVVMYDLSWRFKITPPKDVLTKNELKEYISNVKKVLKYIDDDIICSQNVLSSIYKLYALSLKYPNLEKKLELKQGRLYKDELCVYSFKMKSILHITNLNINKKSIKVLGYLNCPFNDIELFYKYNGKIKKLPLKSILSDISTKNNISGYYYHLKYFEINEKINDSNSIKFYLKYKNNDLILLNVGCDLNSKLSTKYALNYKKHNMMCYLYKKSIIIKKNSLKVSFKRELANFVILLKQFNFKVIFTRLLYNVLKLFNHKKIWLISDRPTDARENGIVFFKYVCKLQDKEIRPYFAISKDSPDYEKVKKIGKVVNFNSFKYKMLFLLSDKLISSQADDIVVNAFGKYNIYYRDLYTFDFIFLQHGIILLKPISSWLNHYYKNINMFVTSATREYNSIINDANYGYDKSIVKLTGLARYDNLKNKQKKVIALLPTWRKELVIKRDEYGKPIYNENFKKSEYFKFYNNLINDKKLLNVMEKYGYTGLFACHIGHLSNVIDYQENDTFKVIKTHADYNKIFNESSLLISDYSSVILDFTYLNKPVIYSHFDKDEFYFNNTYSKCYFDFDKDGFGPVCYTYDDLVDTIINYIKNDCQLENIYKKRIDKFYKFHDKNNCKRIYNEIKKIK